MAYLFTPPQRFQTQIFAGRSLRWTYPVSQTVWKDADGVWQAVETPSTEDLVDAQLFYQTPAIIPDGVAGELIAANIGTCVPIET